jgi:DNA-binding NarL/FixJ family response regulator
MRVVIADDATVVREGIASLLTSRGVDVAGQAADAPGLLRLLRRHLVDVAIIDIRMPPTHTDEGLRAAEQVRQEFPDVGVMVFSQYVEPTLALRLLSGTERATGYLLKERVTDAASFVADLRRVAAGETVVDPTLVGELIASGARRANTDPLTPREWAVLEMIAAGRTDRAIAEALHLSQKTVEGHVSSLFRKLRLPASYERNRRVHAVLWFLQERR